MSGKKIVVVGNMVASKHGLEPLGNLLARQYAVKAFFAGGGIYPASLEEMLTETATADAVVLGMASSAKLAEEELAVGEAAGKRNVPIYLYADTFKSWGRMYFEDLIKKYTPTLFVLNDEEAKLARMRYPEAKVVASSNPEWETFAAPKFSREEVRERLGIAANEKLVQVPFGKDLELNMLLAGCVIEAMSRLMWHNPVIVFCLHPGDLRKDEHLFDNLPKWSKVRVLVPELDPKVFGSNEIVAGADLLIGSISTINLRAAGLRKPVIDFLTQLSINRYCQTNGLTEFVWEPVEQGISLAVHGSIDKLAREAERLLDLANFAQMRKRQEEVMKPGPIGTAVGIMAKEIERAFAPTA